MPSVSRVLIRGFRSLSKVDLSPGRVTALIGANGSGKSNLLAALRMVPLMRTHSLRRFVGEAGGASALLHYGPSLTREIEIRLEFELETAHAVTNAYEARLGYAANDSLIFLDEMVGFRKAGTPDFKYQSLGAGHAESKLDEAAHDQAHTTAKAVRRWIARMSFFHFHDTSATAPLRQNARQEDVRFLRSDGSNLAAFLRRLSISEGDEDRKAWNRIGLFVQRVAPFIKELSPTLVDPKNPATSTVRLDWIDERDQRFGPHHLSDGTLRALALVTALAQPASDLPRFMTIDEPELGLHPSALELVVSLIRSVAPHCQVLMATQSPALLDLLAPEEVVVAERAAGSTTFKRLEPEKLQAWLADYSLSELYGKNLFGGLP